MKKTLEKANRRAVAGLLAEQLRIIAEASVKARTDHSPEPLHDIRIGLRRFAQLLRLFRKPLADTNAESVRAKIQLMTRAIGTIRDADVWIERLQAATEDEGAGKDNARWMDYFTAECKSHKQDRRKFPALLASRRFVALVKSMRELIRSGIPRSHEIGLYGKAGNLAGRRTAKLVRRILAEGMPGPNTPVLKLHAFRRLCRRGRYWADAAGALGNRQGRLAGGLKSIATELGSIHDLDMAQARFRNAASRPPAGLSTHLREVRNKTWYSFTKSWIKFEQQATRAVL